jgi:uncharacterized protein (TIGR00251 family)
MEIPEFMDQAKNTLKSEGVFYFRVKAIPKSPKTEMVEIMNSEELTVKIRLKAIPDKGKANQVLCKFLAKQFKAQAEVVSGKKGTMKLVKLTH